MARQVADKLIAYGMVVRGQLGVMIQDLTPTIAQALGLGEVHGAVVSRVMPDSPAAAAGLKAGDVIVELNGTPVNDAAGLRNGIGMLAPGTEVRLDILRDGKAITASAKLVEQRAETAETGEQPTWKGARLGPIPADNPLYGQIQGLYVEDVKPSSNADTAGLQAGDIIISADNQAVTRRAQLDHITNADKQRQRPTLLQILRGDEALFIAVE
jgi:S1-C subfamily serine protease